MATNKQKRSKIKLFKFSCEYTCQWVLAELIVFSMYTTIKVCVDCVCVCVNVCLIQCIAVLSCNISQDRRSRLGSQEVDRVDEVFVVQQFLILLDFSSYCVFMLGPVGGNEAWGAGTKGGVD